MEIKERLCEAFCEELEVRSVPVGVAVRTGFSSNDGDSIGFYVTRHPANSLLYRIEDSGLIVPSLEAAGVNLESGTRADAFSRLLAEHGAIFDDDTFELRSEYVSENDIPAEAMRFIALLLRVRDLELLTTETVENTFREDAEVALRHYLGDNVELKLREKVSALLPDYIADALIQGPNSIPVAVYFATSDSKVDEAVMLWMENRLSKLNIKVALLLEKEKPSQISSRPHRRAMNRLDTVASFRGDELAAMQRIGTFAGVEARQWQ